MAQQELLNVFKTDAMPAIGGVESLFKSMANLNKPVKPSTKPQHNLPVEATMPSFQIVNRSKTPVPALAHRGDGTPEASPPGTQQLRVMRASRVSPVCRSSPVRSASPFQGIADGIMAANSYLAGSGAHLDKVPEDPPAAEANPTSHSPSNSRHVTHCMTVGRCSGCALACESKHLDLRYSDDLKVNGTDSVRFTPRIYRTTMPMEWLVHELPTDQAEQVSTSVPRRPLRATGPATQATPRDLHDQKLLSQLDPEKKSHVTSVGLAIDGDVIHGFHPQFEFSKLEVGDSKLEVGDRILKIDGKQVDSFGTGLVRALIGDDIVGSLVNITVAKPDGSEVNVSLRRHGMLKPNGEIGQSDFAAKDSSKVFARPPITPLGPVNSSSLAKKSSVPSAILTLRDIHEGFSDQQLSLLNGLASLIQGSIAPQVSDHVYSEREFEAGYKTKIEDVGLSTATVFQMLDMDSDGFISHTDLVQVRFFFNENANGERKLKDLMDYYLNEDSGSDFPARMKKMFLCATRSFFKLRSVIYGATSAPSTEAGPSPALVMKAVQEVCEGLQVDVVHYSKSAQFLQSAAANATLKAWLQKMDCLAPPMPVSKEPQPMSSAASSSPPFVVEVQKTPKPARQAPPQTAVKADAPSPSSNFIKLSTGELVEIPTLSNKFESLVQAALHEVQTSSSKVSASLEAALKRSEKSSLNDLLEDDCQGSNEESFTSATSHPGALKSKSKSEQLAVERLQTILGLWMDGSTVVNVNAGSPAEGNLMVGDKIVQINTRRVLPEHLLIRLAFAAIPNARLHLTVLRSAPSPLGAIERDVLLITGAQLEGQHSREDWTRRSLNGMLRADDESQQLVNPIKALSTAQLTIQGSAAERLAEAHAYKGCIVAQESKTALQPPPAQDFLSSMTRFNSSLVKANPPPLPPMPEFAAVTTTAASPPPGQRLHLRSVSPAFVQRTTPPPFLPAVEAGGGGLVSYTGGGLSDGGLVSYTGTKKTTDSGKYDSFNDPPWKNQPQLRAKVEEIFNQYDKTGGRLTVSQAAIVASVLHQKLFTGVERSSKALTAVMQVKLQQHYDRRPVDLDSFCSWYLDEVSGSAVSSP